MPRQVVQTPWMWNYWLLHQFFFEGKSQHLIQSPTKQAFLTTLLWNWQGGEKLEEEEILAWKRLYPWVFSPKGIRAKQPVKSIRAPIVPYSYYF